MEPVNIKKLKAIKFIKCSVVPNNGGPDDGGRVFVTGDLPPYLHVKEIIDGDALNLVLACEGGGGQAERDSEVLLRFLIPCAAGCESLGDQPEEGCNTLHIAAHHPEKNVAELAVFGARISLYSKHFRSVNSVPELVLYSDDSVLLRSYPNETCPPQAFGKIPDFIARHADSIGDANIGSALQQFRLYAAHNHIECWFEAFLPK